MTKPNLIILYVQDPAESAVFYKELLDREPAAAFPTYVAFALDGGFMLGFWSALTVKPAPPKSGNRMELAFTVKDTAAVDSLCDVWRKRGLRIEQEPMTAVFGRTFVALDPDGHRLRVCTPDK